ncbi:hypothetical protein ACSQ67_010837 [Phaseolus vulgaris]
MFRLTLKSYSVYQELSVMGGVEPRRALCGEQSRWLCTIAMIRRGFCHRCAGFSDMLGIWELPLHKYSTTASILYCSSAPSILGKLLGLEITHISKVTEERNFVIEQNKRLQQELVP